MSNAPQSAAALDLEALLGPEARRSPEMEAVWQWLLDQDVGLPDWTTLPAAAARAQQDGSNRRWNADLPAMDAVEPIILEGATPVRAELLKPKAARPGCLLFLHGGGWAFGTLETYARFTRLLAEDTRMRVLAVDYRLAPEHPFPAGLDDCRAAWRALVRQGHAAGFDGPLGIAGDSAGANLALAVTLDEIREGRRHPDFGLLFYGAFAAGVDSPSAARFADGYGLTRAAMRRFWDWYVPEADAARGSPQVSPLRAPDSEIARLPPLFVNAAGLDPLLSDSVALVRRLEAAGIAHAFHLHEGVHHGFMQMSLRLPEARAAIRQAAAFVEARAGR